MGFVLGNAGSWLDKSRYRSRRNGSSTRIRIRLRCRPALRDNELWILWMSTQIGPCLGSMKFAVLITTAIRGTRTLMVDKRSYEYMGFEMTSDLGEVAEDSFYVATQRIRETTQGIPIDVPIDGVAAGCFRSMENVFDASFDRMRAEIDREVDAGRTH